ncbi:MAG: hypothetical protein JW797_00530 [Bradymonadales bacterium]|nr:hypothetical protein [Bradymonadales bacterium]
MIITRRWVPICFGLALAATLLLASGLTSCTVDADDQPEDVSPDGEIDLDSGTDVDALIDSGSDIEEVGEVDQALDLTPDTAETTDLPAETDQEEPVDPNALHPRFDPEGAGFFRMPWPSDYRRDENGHLLLDDFPQATHFMVELYVTSAERNLTGFSTMPVVYVGFDRDPTAASLPEPAETLSSSSPVQLVDVSLEGCGERIPIEVHFEIEGDPFLDPNTLKAAPVPGFVLAPDRPYALVILRSFGAEADLVTSPPELFSQILGDTAESTALAATYTPLLDCAETAGIDLDEVAMATVFTTQNPTDECRKMRNQVADPAQTAAPVVTGWSYSEEGSRDNEFDTYIGRYQTPIFQEGTTPYAITGGGLVLDEEGEPVVQRWEEVRFALSFPLQGSSPYPVMIWEPGTGDGLLEYTQYSMMRDGLAAGFAIASFEPQFHGTRSGTTAEPVLHSFNYLNPEAGRTGFRQQAVDTAYFVRVVREALDELPNLPALDTTTLLYAGHSQGAIVGGLIAGVETELVAYGINGIGAYLSITIIERKTPQDINSEITSLLGLSNPLDQFHPVVALAQLLGDVVDPINYAPFWRGWEDHPEGNSLFLTNGMHDATTPLRGLNAMTISGGVQPIDPPGWDVDPFDVWEMEPAELPIQGNTLSFGGNELTIATELVAETGHSTIYQRPEVRARAVRFWLSALQGVPALTAE